MVAYHQLSEVEVIERINNGDLAVFEVLIRRYNPYLYKVGRSYGFNHQDVEDLMQETFIKAYQNLKKLENKQFFKTWLIRIMLNECYKKNHKASFLREIINVFVNPEELTFPPEINASEAINYVKAKVTEYFTQDIGK